MDQDDRRIFACITALYDAAIDSEKWPNFLRQVARTFGAKGAQIVRVRPDDELLSFSALHGYEDAVMRLYSDGGNTELPTAMARYERHFSELMPSDPRMKWVERYPNRPLSCRLELSEAELHDSKVYREMLHAADVEYSLVVSLREDDGSLIVLGVFRPRQATHFDQHDVDTFSELLPHLKQAIAVSEQLTRANFASGTLSDALDTVAVGILIVDESARLVHANAAGRRILDLSDGLTLSGDRVRLHTGTEDAAFRRSLRETLSAALARKIQSCEAIAVTRPSGREALPMMVGALRPDKPRLAGPLSRPVAAVFVSLPEEPHEAPAELLRRLFGLTSAEARVYERIVHGYSVEEIARELDLAVDTIRVHLKRMFAKMQVSRQAELVAKVTSTPLWIRRHEQSRHTLKA
jgi:DNA-binding CsgD family transcriptional regulator/PAS domain-containing protein